MITDKRKKSAQIKKMVEESINTKRLLFEGQIENIEQAACEMTRALRAGGKVLIFGNGGSASDSQHIAAELVGRFKRERRPLAAVALTANTSILSAIANDYGYESVFSRQLEALGKKGDVALGISTSGRSKNVIMAIRKAGSIGMKTIGLTGSGGGKLRRECDICITVPSADTARIQESHAMVGHILCELIEDAF